MGSAPFRPTRPLSRYTRLRHLGLALAVLEWWDRADLVRDAASREGPVRLALLRFIHETRTRRS